MNKRVLVVDDSNFMRMMIKSILKSHGFEIVGEARNGLDALLMYEKLKPNVVTMDITMPEFNGIKGVKAITAIYPDANIIVVSSMSQESFVNEALTAGAKGYVLKPFSKEQLLKSIEVVLSKK